MNSGGPRKKTVPIRPRTSRLVLYLVLGLASLLVLNFLVAEDGLPAIQQRRSQVEAVRADVLQVRAANTRLKARIRALREGDYLVEKTAREELDFAAPGELIYLFPEDLASPPDGHGGVDSPRPGKLP